jgi:hypothetical protein
MQVYMEQQAVIHFFTLKGMKARAIQANLSRGMAQKHSLY